MFILPFTQFVLREDGQHGLVCFVRAEEGLISPLSLGGGGGTADLHLLK